MAGANYADHAFDMAKRQNPDITMEQVREQARSRGIAGFWKLSEFVVDPEADITYPAKSKYLDYEGEISIVIGKTVKDFKGSSASTHIWGYTLQNDWSARDVGDAALGGLSWSSQKNWDCSSSIGPCIVVGEISDPQNVDFQTTVNGAAAAEGQHEEHDVLVRRVPGAHDARHHVPGRRHDLGRHLQGHGDGPDAARAGRRLRDATSCSCASARWSR